MKIQGDSMSVISGGDISKTAIGLSAKNSYLAAYYLRDRIYENKILAVVREYATNAIDEHLKHNIEKPVELSITTDDTGQSFFNVRDYASGLDDSGVRNIFGMYFESTKTASNEAMGGFGIGSKAGHAYGNIFNVSSYHNGTATHYTFPLETTADQPIAAGAIYNLYSEPTTETGIQITVPIKKTDYRDLSQFRNYCQWFVKTCRSTTNIVFKEENSPPQSPAILQEILNPNYPHYKFYYSDSDDAWYYGQSQSVIRMGDVCYPIPYAWTRLGEYSKLKINTNIIIDVPVGTFSLPLSREAVENTPTNLKEFEKIVLSLSELEKASKTEFNPTIKSLIGHSGKFVSSIFGWGFSDFGIPFYSCTLAGGFAHNTPFEKYVLVVIPKNRATREWYAKMNEWAKLDPTTGYLYYSSSHNPLQDIEFNNTIKTAIAGEYEHLPIQEVRRRLVKKFNKPNDLDSVKLSKGHHGKLVYFQMERKHLVTIDEFKAKFPSVPQLDEMKTLAELASYCYHPYEIGYMSTSEEQTAKWYVLTIKSERLRGIAKSIGLYAWGDPKVGDAWRTIKAQMEESEQRRYIITKLTSGFGLYTPTRPIKNIQSKTVNMANRAAKAQAVLETIVNETSPRGEILKKLHNQRTYYSHGLSRHTLRKLLLLK
jgi:hypothetical protein